MTGDVRAILMFMLWGSILGLILSHSSQFSTVFTAFGNFWTQSLRTLQLRD